MNFSDSSPQPGYHFSVHFMFPAFAQSIETRFREIHGIRTELKMEKSNDTGQNAIPEFAPIGVDYGELVLIRGLVKGSMLINWMEAGILRLKKMPIPVVVSQLNSKHSPVYTWTFLNAYPVSWETNGFDAMKSGYLTEKITLKYSLYKQARVNFG